MFHINSPVISSLPLTNLLSSTSKVDVYLKMDALQPSGSFKIRGVGNMCYKAVHEKGCIHLVCASGGNAGKSVAYAGRKMNVSTTIVVPQTTPELMRKKIQEEGATLIVHGSVFDEADRFARTLAAQPGHVYIPPFDHPDIWAGNASLVKELYESVKIGEIPKPAAIVTVCGGGGLLCGIVEGLHEVGWADIPVVVAETDGAHALHHSISSGQLSSLTAITSIAKSLGALQVCEAAYLWTQKHPIIPVLVSDAEAVGACIRFADDHRILIEPSCGAALAVLYSKPEVFLQFSSQPIVVIVCGGNVVSLELIQQWKTNYNIS